MRPAGEVSVNQHSDALTRRRNPDRRIFRDESLSLLNTYCSGVDAGHIYHTYFTPKQGEARYSSMNDLDLIYRCLGIILESIAASGDQAIAADSRIPKASKQES
jgi:hypothetical protein